MQANPLLKLGAFGQSVWLDFLDRSLFESGKLSDLIKSDGVRGITSNPKIFSDAISRGEAYDDDISALVSEGLEPGQIYERIAVSDIRRAADLLRPVHDATGGNDGFVSIEVSPELAYDTDKTVEEAISLWRKVDRPNIFVKIPATREGLPAIRRAISDGINVNVTLLFGLDRYREVVEAYLDGIEERLESGKPVDSVSSVASFFLSRIDVMVDPLLEEVSRRGGKHASDAKELQGKVAIASAKLAYGIYKEVFGGPRCKKLSQRGMKRQRVLWASTGTKNPDYSDVMYVEALVGPETVNTMPLKTLEAYRNHGQPAARLESDLDGARRVFELLPAIGIDAAEISHRLEQEGVRKFAEPFAGLLITLDRKRTQALLAGGS